jgi:ADP-heptose:LPS heptosyltransferase
LKVTTVPEKTWQGLTDVELGGKRDNTVCVIRYGGYGDCLQASSLFPMLKAKGKRVCVNTTEIGQDIYQHDPYIDELFVQKDDQIPNKELGPYWDRIANLFDEVINLAGVVEGGLLVIPRDEKFEWEHERRHASLNKNYSEALHDKANLGYDFKQKFYPSEEEVHWVKKTRKSMRLKKKNFVIVVALSGSSVHKAYPFMDSVIAHFLTRCQGVRFVLTGDKMCQLLEQGWEKESRVFLTSGEWKIRQAIAFAQQADLVIGPETGLLNAVSMDDVPKICFLSHSSGDNLTKHWVNAATINPEGVACFPCHKIHVGGFESCNRDEGTGASLCNARINPNDVADAIKHYRKIRQWH